MIPVQILDYLKSNGVPFLLLRHPRAVDGQRLAAALHISGHRVAKSVIVRADGKEWLAVLPAAAMVDPQRLAKELRVEHLELVPEPEFEGRFPGCEVGAEPPFGRLYGMPVVIDRSLSRYDQLVLRAGSHEESLELSYQDYLQLERPAVASFARAAIPTERWREERPETRV